MAVWMSLAPVRQTQVAGTDSPSRRALPATVVYADSTYHLVGVGRYAFYGCYALTSVVVPEGVATLGQAAFSGCSAMDSIALPSTLISLGVTALYGCTSLTAISCAATVPPTVAGTTFGNVNTSACTLYVPCTATVAYAAATGWADFDLAPYGSCNATVVAQPNHGDRGSVTGSGTYAIGTVVTLAANPADGFFFALWHDGDTLNPRLVTLDRDTSFTAMFYPMQRDTVVSVVVQHDTVVLYDTITVPVVHVDTVVLYDTMWLTDTVQLVDTVTPTYFRLQVLGSTGGVGIGSTLVPAGTELEIGALPIEGYRFTGWDDGSVDNPRRLTLMSNTTVTALFAVVTGIDDAAAPVWTAAVEGRYVVVSGVENRSISLYDTQGRRLFHGRSHSDRLVLRAPSAGVYLVSVDGSPARKVLVD